MNKCKASAFKNLDLKKAINDYIEFYNNTRINSKGTTPNQIRNNSLAN